MSFNCTTIASRRMWERIPFKLQQNIKKKKKTLRKKQERHKSRFDEKQKHSLFLCLISQAC